MKSEQFLSAINFSRTPIQQTSQMSGRCPEGTIPTIRILNKDNSGTNTMEMDTESVDFHYDWAAAYNYNGPYSGAAGEIYLWSPHAELLELALNFIACGDSNGTLESFKAAIFTGWIGTSGDNLCRFFVARMMDNGDLCFSPGCEDTFIQVSKIIAPNDIIMPPSVFGNPRGQFHIQFDIYKDTVSKNWWVSFNGEPVGYYPSNVLNIVEANTIISGGMVSISHSTSYTQMGNGNFPSEDRTRTASIMNARVKKTILGDMLEAPSGYFVTRPSCYNFQDLGPDGQFRGYNYLYGGPGKRNESCT